MELVRYIHLNPLRAKLQKAGQTLKALADNFVDYRKQVWSTCGGAAR